MFLGKCLWEQHPPESERKMGQKKEREFEAAAQEASAQVSSEGGCRSEAAGTAARGGMPQACASWRHTAVSSASALPGFG